jgi:tetratricopeptide (TPR) repeat protein
VSYSCRATARDIKGELDGAVADYTKAIEIDPQYGEAYANRGLLLLNLGRASEAERDFEYSLRLDSKLKESLTVCIKFIVKRQREAK